MLCVSPIGIFRPDESLDDEQSVNQMASMRGRCACDMLAGIRPTLETDAPLSLLAYAIFRPIRSLIYEYQSTKSASVPSARCPQFIVAVALRPNRNDGNSLLTNSQQINSSKQTIYIEYRRRIDRLLNNALYLCIRFVWPCGQKVSRPRAKSERKNQMKNRPIDGNECCQQQQ